MSEQAASETLPVSYIDKTGKRHNAVLKATILGPNEQLPIKKQTPASSAEEDDPYQRLAGGAAQIIDPPYDLDFLSLAVDNSSELGQNIRTMVVNTVQFGYSLRELPELSDTEEKYKEEILKERARIRRFLRSVHPKDSLNKIRSQVKHDKWQIGNGYMELIDNAKGELAGLNHVHGHTVRLTVLDEDPVEVQVPQVVPEEDFKIVYKPMYVRFRRFVQVWNDKLIFFKEAGDDRQLNKETGEYRKEGEPEIQLDKRATSLLHHRIYSPHTPYGVTVWMGNLFSFFGSRAAEELNFNTMTNNGIPSMFLIVENGMLTDSSIARVKEFIESQVKKAANYSRIILLEGTVADEASPNPEPFRIRVEPVAQLQKTDELYQVYDANNRDKLRQCFRIPPLFVGRADTYSRATADTSRDVADEQVFAPDRLDDDELFNRHVMLRLGARFHIFRSMHPNVTDDIELIRMAAIGERSGGMTPYRMDRVMRDIFGEDIGPMPQGVELHVPYSLQFAHAQKTGSYGPERGITGGDAVSRMIEGLTGIKSKVEDEIFKRFEEEDSDEW